MTEFKYVGSELDLFAEVHHWKSYWSSAIRRFIQGDVVEVGAGIGSNTRFLNNDQIQRFVCLEPDAQLLARLKEQVRQEPRECQVVCGTTESLAPDQQFDTIIY